MNASNNKHMKVNQANKECLRDLENFVFIMSLISMPRVCVVASAFDEEEEHGVQPLPRDSKSCKCNLKSRSSDFRAAYLVLRQHGWERYLIGKGTWLPRRHLPITSVHYDPWIKIRVSINRKIGKDSKIPLIIVEGNKVSGINVRLYFLKPLKANIIFTTSRSTCM